MPKLDLEKNTWITDARADFAQGGFWNGAYMVTLTMSGSSCPGNDFIASVILKIGAQKLPRNRRIVRISGLLSPTDASLGLLVKMLYDYGYSVQVVLSDLPKLSWLPYVSWIAYRTPEVVVPVAFDELWYEPPEISDIPEPVLPKPRRNPNGTLRDQFLYLKRAGNAATVTKFVCESERLWQLL